MPSIRKRKSGLYEARISFKGKYFSVYERNLQKLKTKTNKKIKELQKEYKNTKTLADTKKDWITLEKWYEEWLENDKKPFIGKATLKSIENCFKNHILKSLGKVKLQDLNKSKIQAFLNNMPKSRVKEITSNYFKACITQAYKERLIQFNPFDTVRIEKKIKSNKSGFTANEQNKILEHLKTNDKEWYNLILCFLCLGCRRAEIKTIKIDNIKNNLVYIEGTKTAHSKRYVNITSDFQNLLLETLPTIQRLSIDRISKKFKKILNKLNIQGSIHSLRHTFVTNHFYLGTTAKQVQNWVGHSSIQITLDIYTNINPQIDASEEKNKIKKLYNNLYYYKD